MRIGFRHDSKGRRVERVFYWSAQGEGSTPPPSVIADAVRQQDEWRRIKRSWHAVSPDMARRQPAVDWSKPVWPEGSTPHGSDKFRCEGDAHSQDAQKASLTQLLSAGGPTPLSGAICLPGFAAVDPDRFYGGAAPLPRAITVHMAIDEMLAECEARTRLATDRALSPLTVAAFRQSLFAAFGHSSSKKMAVLRQTPVHTQMPLSSVQKPQIKALADYWHRVPEGVRSSHTVRNYLNAARQFFQWCAQHDDYGWSFPAGLGPLLSASAVRTAAKAFDPAQLHRVLNPDQVHRQRLRLFALLALTCGYYQKDICDCRSNEYFVEHGHCWMKRYRSKESKPKRGRRPIRVKHWIAPELAAMIEGERAKPTGQFLLSRDSAAPLTRRVVSGLWERACKRAAEDLEFKQLRKIGYNAIKRLSGSIQTAELWDGHARGVTDSYDDGVFEPLIRAEQRWADELRRHRLICVPTFTETS